MVSVVVVPHDSFMVKRWPPNPTMVIAEKVDMIMRSSQRGSRCVVVGCYGRERLDFSAFRSNNETRSTLFHHSLRQYQFDSPYHLLDNVVE